MGKKDLVRLQLMLRQVFERRPLKPGDSVYIIPLPDEFAKDTAHFGHNNDFTLLFEKKAKIIL